MKLKACVTADIPFPDGLISDDEWKTYYSEGKIPEAASAFMDKASLHAWPAMDRAMKGWRRAGPGLEMHMMPKAANAFWFTARYEV